MTARFFITVCSLLVTGLCALSLGGRIFYMASWALILMIAYSLLSLLAASRMIILSQETPESKLMRGSSSKLLINIRNKSLLPIGPLQIQLDIPGGETKISLDAGFLRQKTVAFPFFLPHIGVIPVGAKQIFLQDIFRLFLIKKYRMQQPLNVVVLPRPFDVDKLQSAHMDDGRALPNQTTEDITAPDDVRNYRPGDPLKRIHWKLSSRKRELLVRRFELPAPPDTLVLMDCSDPVGFEEIPDGLNRLKDTLAETALAVAKMQMEGGNPVRLPLYGARIGEFKADREGSLALLQEELAYQIFRGGEAFEKVLNVELRRMRRTGASIVITTRLDVNIVEGVKHIRRSGPSVRFYLVTFHPENPQYDQYVMQLQRHLVEVCYVTPA
ncbi:MAG: DUF58 domain-containing protein [Clostridiales bacterium]|nr:DUF58 domain-containing protein [Clostridiales bacterium]